MFKQGDFKGISKKNISTIIVEYIFCLYIIEILKQNKTNKNKKKVV